MSNNTTEVEMGFCLWERLFPELRRHTLSYCDKSTLHKYSQCSKRSNNNVQEYDTMNPLTIEVKDLHNSKMGVMVKMEYKKRLEANYRYSSGPVSIDDLEALIEIKTKEGNVSAAETAKNELAALRAEYEDAEKEVEIVRITGRLVKINDYGVFQIEDPQERRRLSLSYQRQVQLEMRYVLAVNDIGPRKMINRRKARIERENHEQSIAISFVAVGPNQHKMILNRPLDMEDGILEGNAVDAAYEYLAKRLEKKKSGRINELRLNVKKWPARFMESKAIQQGVRNWDVTMYRTIYEEFMQHMRMDMNPKNMNIKPGYGMGKNKFQLPSDFLTIFRSHDSVNIGVACQPSNDAILQTDCKSLSIPASAITDMGINAKIRQLINDTTDANIHIWRSSKFSPGRGKFDKAVIFGDLLGVRGLQQGWTQTLRRKDGGMVYVDFLGGHCQVISKKLQTSYY